MKMAIFLPNWVGDLTMATPTLRALRRHFPRPGRIVGILRPHLAELLGGATWLDELWPFDHHTRNSGWGRLALVHRLRRERFDVAVLLTNSLHTALLAWLGRAKTRIGYARDYRAPFLTHRLYAPRDGRRWRPTPVVDSYLALAQAAGCPAEPPRLELVVTGAERRTAERIFRDLGLRGDGRIIALNSSGAYGSAKVWPAQRCGILARQIVQQLDHDVLVLCGPAERQAAREIVECAASPRVFSLADQSLGLSVTKACLEQTRMLVSTDSGPRHVAAAVGKPVVTLMGPTLPQWIANPTVQDRIVRLELDCLGCGKRVCPRGHHRCMRDLTPDRVLAEVAGVLEETTTRAA